MNFETHDFYCLNCGQKNFPIARKNGHMHGAFHRKRLWCYRCKQEINCVEIRNDQEKQIFMEAFNNGEFREEAAESVRACKPAWQW